MTDESAEEFEEVEISSLFFQNLLRLTGENIDCQLPPMRAVTRVVHSAVWVSPNGKWRLKMNEEEMRTFHAVLQDLFVWHPKNKTRFTNVLCRQSWVYEDAQQEFDRKLRGRAA